MYCIAVFFFYVYIVNFLIMAFTIAEICSRQEKLNPGSSKN